MRGDAGKWDKQGRIVREHDADSTLSSKHERLFPCAYVQWRDFIIFNGSYKIAKFFPLCKRNVIYCVIIDEIIPILLINEHLRDRRNL